MASYPQPIENIPIFDPSLFPSNSTSNSGTEPTPPPNLNTVLQTGNNGGGRDIVGVNNLTVSTLNYTTLNPPVSGGSSTLEQVLTNGNSAGNLNITDVNEITVDTLNYTTLNPPVSGGSSTLEEVLTNGDNAGQLNIINVNTLQADTVLYTNLLQGFVATYTLSGGATISGNNITVPQQSGSLGGFVSTTTYLNPSVSATVNFEDTGGYVKLGFDYNNQFYGAFWYGPQSYLYVVNNGVNGLFVPLAVGTVEISVIILNGNLNIYINGAIASNLEISVPSANYAIYGITNQQTVSTNFTDVITWYAQSASVPTLAQVLASGSSGGNASITDLTAITVGTLNYTTLNPPVSGGSQNIEQVLTVGNNANGKSITGIDTCSTNSLTCQNTSFFVGNTNTFEMAVNTGKMAISGDGFTTVGFLYDSHYNQPPSTGVTPTLEEVLTAGNSAPTSQIIVDTVKSNIIGIPQTNPELYLFEQTGLLAVSDDVTRATYGRVFDSRYYQPIPFYRDIVYAQEVTITAPISTSPTWIWRYSWNVGIPTDQTGINFVKYNFTNFLMGVQGSDLVFPLNIVLFLSPIVVQSYDPNNPPSGTQQLSISIKNSSGVFNNSTGLIMSTAGPVNATSWTNVYVHIVSEQALTQLAMTFDASIEVSRNVQPINGLIQVNENA
jgi:hypothetical protein